jgi:hypothetical protein
MRFMVLVKTSEALPDMGRYNEQLAKAGVLLEQGTLAGYWLIQARSQEEAIEWAKRVPFHDGEIEIHRLLELSNDVV